MCRPILSMIYIFAELEDKHLKILKLLKPSTQLKPALSYTPTQIE